jgi:hypothetical protein
MNVDEWAVLDGPVYRGLWLVLCGPGTFGRQRWHNRRGFALARLGESVSIALKLKVRRDFWFVITTGLGHRNSPRGATYEQAYHALPSRPTYLSTDKLLLAGLCARPRPADDVPGLETGLGNAGSVRFLHPSESLVLSL